MFTKHAYMEAQVLDVKGSPVRQHTASLDKVSDYENYRTSDGYMYVRIRAISSRVNKNHDGWPSVELAGSPEIFKRHQGGEGFVVEATDGNDKNGFATFIGKPIFVDHNNTNPRKARGVIVDAKFRVLDQRTAASDDYWTSSDVDAEHLPASEVELLLEVDANAYPKFAKAILNGDLDGFSMGANVEYTKCSHCGNIAHDPKDFCSHVLMKGAHHEMKTADGKKVSRKSYENCYKVAFFEISGVFEPADETALSREVRAGILREGEVVGPAGHGTLPDPLKPEDAELQVENHAQWLMHQFGYDPMQAMELARQKYQQDNPTPGAGEGAVYTPSRGEYAPLPQGFPPPRDLNAPTEGFGGAAEQALNERYPNRPVRNDPRWSSTRTAENPLPQDMMTRAPDEVDTLREEQVCPVCGSDMDSETCKVCGYVAPPKEFDNPNLDKAQQIRDEMKQQDDTESSPDAQPQAQAPGTDPAAATDAPHGQGPLTSRPSKAPATAAVTNDMRWTPMVHPRTAARINQSERPVQPSGQPVSNEPSTETVVSDQTRPVTAAMLTARRLMEAAQRNHTGDPMNTRTADGPTPPGDTSPKERVDVTGVGGVDESSNDSASKADAQIDVTGVGGTGVSDVSADKTETLPEAGRDSDDAGFNTDKTTEDSGPTSTYGDKDGQHPGVGEPVTREPFPRSEDGVKANVRRADDNDKPFVQQPQQGGDVNDLTVTPSKGTQPADPVGKAQDRINLYDHATSPANNSGPTKTWSGTDGNGVTRQADPTTDESMEWGGVKTPDVQLHTRARVINAMRLADTELELGLLDREAKWNRIEELSIADPAEVSTRLATLQQVKTAGLQRLRTARTARSLPRAFGKETAAAHDFERIASTEAEEKVAVDDTVLDSGLFMR